jgi:hypothetical protein
MRKFARSIGSEGKRQGQREGQCPFSVGRFVVSVFGFGRLPAAGDRSVCVKATFLRSGNRPPLGTPVAACRGQRIANSELLTAGNPTV